MGAATPDDGTRPTRTRRRRVLVLAAVVAAGVLAWFVADQAVAFAACRRLSRLCMTRTATPEEMRTLAHRALRFRFSDPHLPFQVLEAYGDESSVPHLRAALARKPSGPLVPCSWAHGEEALARITGAAAGTGRDE